MFHYIHWTNKTIWDLSYLISDSGLWVRAYYAGIQSKGQRYLYPILDDNHKTVIYYAFDTSNQLERFLSMAKVAWVWPKLAFILSNTNESDLSDAVANMDTKFFQLMPGIGPKLAKRLVMELKDSVSQDDLIKLNIDRNLYSDIIKTLGNLGYKTTHVDWALQSCPHSLTKDKLPDIMKYLITKMK